MSRAAAVVAFAFAVTMLGTTLPTPLYAIYQHELGFSDLVITAIFATYAGGVIAALLLVGRASDSVGRRPLTLVALGWSALSAVMFLLAHSLVILLLGRLLSGFSAGIITGTASAWLTDLFGDQRDRAAVIATACNIGGLGLGPPLAGILAQTTHPPTRIPFWVDLALLAVAAAGVASTQETVTDKQRFVPRLQQLTIPPEARSAWITAALSGFGGFAVLGLFTSVSPAFVGRVLGYHSHAAAGAIVAVVFISSALAQIGLKRIPDMTAIKSGTAIQLLGAACIGGALLAKSLPLLLAGAVIAGTGQGLGFRGGMSAVAAHAPAAVRAATISSLFVVLYVAISVPVLGVGFGAQAADLRSAGVVFSAAVVALSLVVLARLRVSSET